MRRFALLSMLLMLGACTSTFMHPERAELPQPKLSPASFGGSASLAQRLTFERADGKVGQPIEALLEIDSGEVLLAGFALGQRILTIGWNGHELKVERHSKLPGTVSAERVLRDVQYAYWPAASIRAVLPPAWSLDDEGGLRTLRHEGQSVLVIRFAGPSRLSGRVVLDNRLEGYRLYIESAEQSGGTAL